MTPTPLRVAHVVATSGSTGVEAHLVTLLTAFDRAEVEPVLFVARPGPLVDRLRARGVQVEEGAPDRKLALGAAQELASRWRGRFDLVHAHGPRAAFWAERAARRARLPFVLTLHETRWRSRPPGVKRSLWLWLERGSWRRADAVITVSEAMRRELLERVPELAPRVRVVHASAPLLLEGERLPQANPAASADRPMRLVTVGRLEWVKGYERLFEAVAALQRQGLDLSLDIVGAGRDEAALRELAVRLGIVGRLRWLGPLVDLPEVLARSHAFVSATRNETFGVAVLEAMAMGLPVVAPAVGGLPELVVDGVTGSLVTPLPESQLPASLATAVLALARDPAGAARMGNAGAERAREVFGPDPFARGVAATYRDVLEGPGSGGAGATGPGSGA